MSVAAAAVPATTVNPYAGYAPGFGHTFVQPVSAPLAKTQFHIQDEVGQYRFGYSEPTANRDESRSGHTNSILFCC